MNGRRVLLVGLLSLGLLEACGGGGSTSAPPNPVPTIDALSPKSSVEGGPGFALSVVGSNFVPGSVVHWNAETLQTTLVSNNLLTADLPTTALAVSGPDDVTVVNPAPGGGTSNALSFAVPCALPVPAPASLQTRARVGAYYFDGWAGPLTREHFNGLPFGPYQSRQPIFGWQDNSACAVEQQLAWAHNFGIDFFVFDWYFNVAVTYPGENLNSALQITHALRDRHGMQYAILYVGGRPFSVGPADWPSAVHEWVSYMTDPDYVRINGMPVLFIINVGDVRQEFSVSGTAIAQLRAAAVAQGLPGVYVVGGFGVPNGTMGQESLDGGFAVAEQDSYDAVAFYGYPFAPPAVNGVLPFSTLADAGRWTWDQARLHTILPFIPTAMSGWDPRPWNEFEPITGDLMWYARTPQDVSAFVHDAITWVESNPSRRVEPLPAPPMVLIEAWNEFGEGSHILPTAGEGTSYGDALAAMLTAP